MRFPTRLACGLLVCLLPATGCQRLEDERTVQLEGGVPKSVQYDPPRYAQKLAVTASSPGGPVSVYLVKAEDAEAGLNTLAADGTPRDVLAKQENTREASLGADIPAKTGFALLIKGQGQAREVKLKVVGR